MENWNSYEEQLLNIAYFTIFQYPRFLSLRCNNYFLEVLKNAENYIHTPYVSRISAVVKPSAENDNLSATAGLIQYFR